MHSLFKNRSIKQCLITNESIWTLNILVIENYDFNNIWEAEKKYSQRPGKVINNKAKTKKKTQEALLFTKNMQRYCH